MGPVWGWHGLSGNLSMMQWRKILACTLLMNVYESADWAEVGGERCGSRGSERLQ